MYKKYIYFLASVLFWGCAETYQVCHLPDNAEPFMSSRIYMLRTSPVGTIIRTAIFQNNIFVGYLGPKSYLCWDVEPGNILISSVFGNKEYFSIVAKPGETYFLRQDFKFRLISPGSKLRSLTEVKAKRKLPKLKKPIIRVI